MFASIVSDAHISLQHREATREDSVFSATQQQVKLTAVRPGACLATGSGIDEFHSMSMKAMFDLKF